jgi:hypothetical protein
MMEFPSPQMLVQVVVEFVVACCANAEWVGR